MIEVVVGALLREGRVLLGHRRPDKHAFPDTWDLPGGVVEPGESLRAALARELREELDVSVDATTVTLLCRADLGTAQLSAWLVPDWVGEARNAAPEEHDDLRWCGLDDLPPLAHPDVRAAVVRVLGGG
ncbi:8-oxo-dGTP pyrophosphatase MutT (NUDIX family) [Nocardioides cavernae]|uniref:8-oxo-dGTP pyrophosphatase MutT (NUDIX family) n=1 Tax=Nocardioides cavernae TaxID=1921566 RepID=A0A7Y9H2Z2_9ACTN|nr:NUDIX domain-containing protein [Nocardioides cavernae]NYE36900.1 8-oxo-dGTP pyrophosphatase MutT (NUDIX family) [Nocardioides cavernae]